MGLFTGFTKNERRIFTGSVIAAILCFALFASDDLFWWLTSSRSGRDGGEVIGTISIASNDVRYKGARTFSWSHAARSQTVHVGDAVYCSENSTAKIAIGKDEAIEVQPSSLVHFSEVQGQRVADLQLGHFRVQVNGEMRVAINGVPTVIKGEGGEADLEVRESGPPVVRVLKGAVSLDKKTAKRDVASQVEPVERFLPPPKTMAAVAPAVVPPPVAPVVASQPLVPPTLHYTYRLYDIYQADHQSLRLKPPSDAVPIGPNLTWASTQAHAYEIQQSRHEDFDPADVQLHSSKESLKIESSFAGWNYWRVRPENGAWGPSRKFEIDANYLPQSPRFATRHLSALRAETPVTVEWRHLSETNSGWMGYVVEESQSRSFDEQSTVYVYRIQPNVKIAVRSAGRRYIRVRGVNEKRELTDFSDVLELETRLPPPPVQLARQKPVPAATPKAPVEVAKAERVPAEAPVEVAATPAPTPLPQPPASLAARVKPDPYAEYYNSAYTKSHWEIEGLNFIMASNLENGMGSQIPLAGGIGAGVQHWFDQHLGASAEIRTQVLGYNAAGRGDSVTDAEVRLGHRWSTPLHFFSFFRELQITALGGLERYRNSNTEKYVSGYDVIKAGLNLEFPIATRWETGGEALYGMINGGSHKYDLSGHVHYYLTKQTLIGVGYRLNVLDAESPDLSPVHLLPYKEAYGEGYTVFMMHY